VDDNYIDAEAEPIASAYDVPDGEYTDETPPQAIYDAVVSDDDTDETKPKKTTKRESAAFLITGVVGLVGTQLVKTETDVPVGRVLQFEAPLLGRDIDNVLAHTWLDHLLQPLIGTASKIEGIGAALAFPVLVGMYERNEAIGEVVEPLLRDVVSEVLVQMHDVMKSTKRKERAAVRALSDMNEILGIDKDDDPVQAVLESMFRRDVPSEPEQVVDEPVKQTRGRRKNMQVVPDEPPPES
jgi:hypothetical protein